jgi:hypothetical protein
MGERVAFVQDVEKGRSTVLPRRLPRGHEESGWSHYHHRVWHTNLLPLSFFYFALGVATRKGGDVGQFTEELSLILKYDDTQNCVSLMERIAATGSNMGGTTLVESLQAILEPGPRFPKDMLQARDLYT